MDNDTPKKDSKWGTYLVAGIIVAALCVGVLLYIGWFDNNSHTDSPDGDNVLDAYITETPQPDAPGINDWENPAGNDLQQIVVDHATGTNTTPLPE